MKMGKVTCLNAAPPSASSLLFSFWIADMHYI